MIRLKRLYAHDFKQLTEVELFFPETGRVLVQGKNEAGKSTLFEAIFFAFFGQALATESVGRANLEDLIGYERNKARVELDFTVRDRLFRVIRTLNRGKPNVWELEITRGDQLEVIKGNRPVNDRLVSELGFDAEALLNTCFVEQKKLEKLEGLNKTKREESLSKLLNLERLLELEDKLRLRNEDEKMLSRLAKRVELARTQQDLPSAEQDLARTERKLKMIELRVHVISALEGRRAIAKLTDQLQSLHQRREGARTAVAKVDSIDKARRAVAGALDRFDLLKQQAESLDDMRREREEVELAASEQLPALDKRTTELGRLSRGFERLEQIMDARSSAMRELQRLQVLRRELDLNLDRTKNLEGGIEEFENRATRIEELQHEYDIGEELGSWSALALDVGASSSAGKTAELLAQDRDNFAKDFKSTLTTTGVILLAGAAATFIVPLATFYLSHSFLPSLAVGGVLLLLVVLLTAILIRRALASWKIVEHSAAELGKAQGDLAARSEVMAASIERLNKSSARLKEMGVPVPSSPEAAQSRRIEIAGRIGIKTRAELNAEREEVLQSMNYARAQRDEILNRSRDLESTASADEIARISNVVSKADRALERWKPRLDGRALTLQVQPDLTSVREARQDAVNRRKAWAARIQQAAKLTGQIAEGEARAKRMSDDLKITYESARTQLGGDSDPWSPNLGRAAYSDLGRELTAAFEAHGGDKARSQLNSLEKETGAVEREFKIREKAVQESISKIQGLLLELNASDTISADAPSEELEGLESRLQSLHIEERVTLETRVKSLQMRVGALQDTRRRLEHELGLKEESVDLLAASEELDKEEKGQDERKHGAEIVLRARKRIVQKVLPATMDYMRRILPQLTRDRYHDAELDPESFKIKVWDERAGQSGAWKEKNIFSGGTKDQFSLALRLAFALATLPQERGTSPGFIFLDEPLGSFDDERAAALLFLLTEGEIAQAFDQIFLISHVRVQEDRFTHRLRLENGAAIESNLRQEAK